MKNKISYIGVLALMLTIGCQQEVMELEPLPPVTGEPGSADFTKFVSIGNSLTAGYQAGALFQEGQDNSYPKVMSEQFALVSTNDPFDQPDTGSTNGCYNPPTCSLGRLVLFDPDGTGTAYSPAPAPAGTPTMPAPFNTTSADHIKSIAPYTGNKTNLNNFGVPGIILAQILIPATGGPSTSNPAFNPYYARFASNPSTNGTTGSTILGDALAAQPTFFSFWMGNNDVLGFATTGASGAIPMTDAAAFAGYFQTAISTILASNANLKGVVANIPDVTSIPFFKTVAYNAIPLDATTAGQLNAGFAGYNTAMTNTKGALLANPAAFGLSAAQAQAIGAEIDTRSVTFAAGLTNKIVIEENTLVDMGPFWDAFVGAGQMTSTQRAQLAPYEQIRQTTSADLICLSAGAILGKTVGGNPQLINGLTVPLGDQYALIPAEITAIKDRTAAFNATIASVVAGSSNRIALVDANAKFTKLANSATAAVDNIPVNATFAPPYGLFSEDGVHPNNRGSAYIAKIFIEAINEKFGATVPLPSIAKDYSTHLPINP